MPPGVKVGAQPHLKAVVATVVMLKICIKAGCVKILCGIGKHQTVVDVKRLVKRRQGLQQAGQLCCRHHKLKICSGHIVVQYFIELQAAESRQYVFCLIHLPVLIGVLFGGNMFARSVVGFALGS